VKSLENKRFTWIEMGPLANDRRVSALSELVEDARDKGADVRTGGGQHGQQRLLFSTDSTKQCAG